MASERASNRPSFDFGSARSSNEKPEYNRRFVARILDGFVAAVPALLLAVLLPGFAGDLLGALAAAAYILFSDGLTGVPYMRRRSLGKHLMGLRPQHLGDGPMTPETSARRNWTLVLGYFGVLPLVGWLLSLAGLVLVVYETYRVVTDPQGRRWGDELAGTRVVSTSTPFGSSRPPSERP